MDNIQMETIATPQRSFGRRIAALAVAGASLIVACSNDDDKTSLLPDSATETTVALNGADVEAARNLCPEGFGTEMPIKQEFDLSKVGGENALLPSFKTVENDVTTLATPEKVGDTIMTLGCDHPTLLGVMDALYLQTGGFNETGRYSLPDSTLLSVIESRTKLFRENEPVALNTLENLASVILPEGGVVYVDNFNVIAGQATLITAERDENGNATQIVTTEVPTEGLHEGYQLRFNLDDASLTAEQKATLASISELILITPNGDIIVNRWLGEGTTGFEIDTESEDTVPVDTAIAPSDDTTNVDGSKNDKNDNATNDGNTGDNSGDNSGDNGGGGGSGGSGDGDCGSGCGTGGDGSQPGTTEVGPTTTATKPNHTTTTIPRTGTTTTSVFIPSTTTTVRPTTTSTSIPRPTTTTVAPTTTGVKPPMDDCDPNIDVCPPAGSNSISESSSNPIRESMVFGIPGAWVFSSIKRRINKQDRKVIV